MKGNILIVDDEPGALKLLKDILIEVGHVVRPFNNGELALRSISVEAPELFLLDIRMPGMSGFEVCQRIKADKRLKEIPVIFISAASDTEDKVKAFEAGGVDYITKPFQKEEVVARVKTHISLSHAMQKLKKTSEALRMSEESLRIAQTIARIGHWEWDTQSGHFICSDELCRIIGLQSDTSSIAQEAFLNAVHPDDQERVTSQLNGIVTGNRFDIEFRIVLPNGEVRVVHGQGREVFSDVHKQQKIIGTIQDIHDDGQSRMLGVIQDITERKELERKLEEQANTDYLTGCDSRRHFLERAKQELARIHRYTGEMSMLMLDLDHFKNINDQFGHSIGDETLKILVKTCKGFLREVDVIGRLGGEEFAIMLPETGRERAQEVAERLCHAVEVAEIPMEDSPPLHFTTSIGISVSTTEDTGIDTIIKRADKALYKAKNTGRNRVCAELC